MRGSLGGACGVRGVWEAWHGRSCAHRSARLTSSYRTGRGYNIGIRLVDEFLAKAQIASCSNFMETAEVIAKVSRLLERGPFVAALPHSEGRAGSG